jgi:hypothetical protein
MTVDRDEAELRRQQALLAVLAAQRADAKAPPGVQAYRANAHASAERALRVACPTLHALLGGDDFAHLAREFWHAHPPQRGDLGEWSDALPGWIAAHSGLAEWPYLADCARLDLALHHCERAADATLNAASLALLASSEPSRLQLRLMPGVQALASSWPVASIHAAHAGGDEQLFDAARRLVDAGQGEAVVVARDGWRGAVHRIDAPGLAFMQALARGVDLADSIDAAGEGFDFAAWLADAVRCHWLKEVDLVGD